MIIFYRWCHHEVILIYFPQCSFLQFGPRPRHISIGGLIRVNPSQGATQSSSATENGAETNEDGDSVASDGGVTLMAGLNLSGVQTLMRCC